VRAEWRPDGEKRAKIQLILNEIALAEKLLPEADEVKKEVEHVLAHHSEEKGGEPSATERESATIYVMTIMTNEKVLKFLENVK
jgi:FKBP-type peptidyl-prolyl cis-trans isomerase (trigger factor)